MSDSKNLPTQLDPQTAQSNFKAYLAVACQRTGTEINDFNSIIVDVCNEFPKLKDHELKQAMRNGGLGKYGKTYKMTTQDVCMWIRKYLEDKKPKPLLF